MSLFDRDRSADRLPVSLITGYLGSGKTTLLNHLLKRPEMALSAVVINEFGEIGLDHLLVEAVDGETVLMQSGCLCCTIRGDLEQTLRNLVIRRERAEIPRFERILIETTGLADPAPIVQLLLNHPLVSHSLRLDAVVTTIDAVNGMKQLDEHEEAVKQVAIADRLLLTKADLAPPGAIEALRRRGGALNPAATLIEVSHGEIAPDRLFGAALFDPAVKTPDVRRWLAEEAYGAAPDHDHAFGHDAGHRHGHDHDHHHHHANLDVNRHDKRIRAFCLTFDEPLDWAKVALWLGRLRRGRGEDLLRVKGILDLVGEPGPVAVHGVHHVFHPPVALDAWPDEQRGSRIVFIVRDITRAELEESWHAFQAA